MDKQVVNIGLVDHAISKIKYFEGLAYKYL